MGSCSSKFDSDYTRRKRNFIKNSTTLKPKCSDKALMIDKDLACAYPRIDELEALGESGSKHQHSVQNEMYLYQIHKQVTGSKYQSAQ